MLIAALDYDMRQPLGGEPGHTDDGPLTPFGQCGDGNIGYGAAIPDCMLKRQLPPQAVVTGSAEDRRGMSSSGGKRSDSRRRPLYRSGRSGLSIPPMAHDPLIAVQMASLIA
jgi:hypothetical protein